MSNVNYSIDGLNDLLNDLQNLSVFLSTNPSWLPATQLEPLRASQLDLIERACAYALILSESS